MQQMMQPIATDVAWCVLGTWMMVQLIEVLFEMLTHVGSRNLALDGVKISPQ